MMESERVLLALEQILDNRSVQNMESAARGAFRDHPEVVALLAAFDEGRAAVTEARKEMRHTETGRYEP